MPATRLWFPSGKKPSTADFEGNANACDFSCLRYAGEVNNVLGLNDNYAPAADLRYRAIFLVQNYLEERALDTESELQKIYQKL
jgi:hypothetical protein